MPLALKTKLFLAFTLLPEQQRHTLW
uniref:Uncharacterized protein n=1 Tax=Moniliophthora roreri TaxID=221103 RepID=A0A0W0EWM8_MONRR